MEKISNFKTFSKKSAEANAIKLGEENEVKRNAIAERVKEVLSKMDISSLYDLTEDQKQEFINTLFTEDEIEIKIDGDYDIEVEKEDEEEVSEADITSDAMFRKYAKALLKKAFGDDFDAEKAEETIDGLIKKYDDYGAMVGAIQSSLSK